MFGTYIRLVHPLGLHVGQAEDAPRSLGKAIHTSQSKILLDKTKPISGLTDPASRQANNH
jgi:hypothetical protein